MSLPGSKEIDMVEWERQTRALARGCAQLAMFASSHEGAKEYADAALRYWREVEPLKPTERMLEDLGLTDEMEPTQPCFGRAVAKRGEVRSIRVPYDVLQRWVRAGARKELDMEIPVGTVMRIIHRDTANAPIELEYTWDS